ncbi:MAG: class I SAM-dependent methyltransferase [Deltaproteobacteria bacterium]|nr:class I SAM-dependent methyltransferase [Deltaproteobacteria bacterium]
MSRPRHSEAWLRSFHDARPGLTSAALAATDSYSRLVATVSARSRILDLGCGDGHLGTLLARDGVIGVDVSRGEATLARARGVRVVQARASELPFAAGAFDAAVSHLAFLLFDDVEAVVAELARVLVPGGTFAATLGGGPVAGEEEDDDAFHAFLALLARLAPPASPRLGDPRARSDAGWRELFAGWRELAFARHVVELADFDAAWSFLGASYELAATDADAIRHDLAAWWRAHPDRRRCRIVTWLATVRRPD